MIFKQLETREKCSNVASHLSLINKLFQLILFLFQFKFNLSYELLKRSIFITEKRKDKLSIDL